MNEGPNPLTEIPAASRRFAKRALDLGVNRVELLLVELQEERERLLQALLYALAAAVFGLLAGMSLTLWIVLLFWKFSPLLVAAVLTVLYGGATAFLFVRLERMRRDWQAFSATLDQLRKDSACLNHLLH
ncbi:MAG TPA: phage holin family protein [Candidatus Baltobacteraceae bacterium]|jgi:uncharacterized membrane protein YqjE|nr:phage holin family protein [Candidatus Baltobacteraceae bacterium]